MTLLLFWLEFSYRVGSLTINNILNVGFLIQARSEALLSLVADDAHTGRLRLREALVELILVKA